jgi:hypothetical protein
MGKGRDKKKKKSEGTAKNKQKEVLKSQKTLKKKSNEEEEDIDLMLADFSKQQLEMYAVTTESNSDPPQRRANASLCVNPLNQSELLLFGGEYFNGKNVTMYNDFYKVPLLMPVSHREEGMETYNVAQLATAAIIASDGSYTFRTFVLVGRRVCVSERNYIFPLQGFLDDGSEDVRVGEVRDSRQAAATIRA